MGIITFISSRNYIALNKKLMKEYGLHEAILLGELASEYEYWAEREQITEDGYFYSTVENVKENTSLSDRQQRAAINSLKKRGIINVKLKGQPPKRFFKINENAILNLLIQEEQPLQNATFNSCKMQDLNLTERDTNKNNVIKIKNENNNKNNICIIIDYLNEKAKTNFRSTSKATQSHINARLQEGFTVDDFKTVIDKKSSEWLGTDFAQYLRPATLFGTKFEAYLNAPIRTRSQGKNGIEVIEASDDDLAGIL